MARRTKGDVLLVGSMPFDTVEEAMRAAGEHLGDHLPGLTDGEVGLRKIWVGFVPLTVYSKNPALEAVKAPQGPPTPPAERPEMWEAAFDFRIKPGADLRFEDLHYGGIAIESYGTYRRLREEGVIPEGVCFQITYPGTGSAVSYFFGDPDQWPQAHAAYHDAVRRDIERILSALPPEDLQFQFDFAFEFVDLAGGDKRAITHWPDATYDEKVERHAAYLEELAREIPEEATLGYHWCYGTWGGWPMNDMRDLAACVRMANEAVARTPRRLDYIHMPVVRHPQNAFFAPLGDLDVGDTYVYLGLIHHTDGVEGFTERMQLARRHLDEFGIASVCGYGRLDPHLLPDVLALHRDCAAELRRRAVGA